MNIGVSSFSEKKHEDFVVVFVYAKRKKHERTSKWVPFVQTKTHYLCKHFLLNFKTQVQKAKSKSAYYLSLLR